MLQTEINALHSCSSIFLHSLILYIFRLDGEFAIVDSLMGEFRKSHYEMVGVWRFQLSTVNWDACLPQLYKKIGQTEATLGQLLKDAQSQVDALKKEPFNADPSMNIIKQA